MILNPWSGHALKLGSLKSGFDCNTLCNTNLFVSFLHSQGLRISINYKPVCVAPTIQKKENGIDLVCTVDSKPQSNSYRWLFNSSETTFEIPSAESTMFFSNYKPSTEEDHGQVLCWASNSLGEQSMPCVFRVVPLASPAPPQDCEVSWILFLSIWWVSFYVD